MESLQKAIAGIVPLRAKRSAQTSIAEFQWRHKAFEKAAKAQPAAKLDVQAISANLLQSAVDIGAGKLVVGQVPDAAPDQMLTVVDSLKKKTASYAILLAPAGDGKMSF